VRTCSSGQRWTCPYFLFVALLPLSRRRRPCRRGGRVSSKHNLHHRWRRGGRLDCFLDFYRRRCLRLRARRRLFFALGSSLDPSGFASMLARTISESSSSISSGAPSTATGGGAWPCPTSMVSGADWPCSLFDLYALWDWVPIYFMGRDRGGVSTRSVRNMNRSVSSGRRDGDLGLRLPLVRDGRCSSVHRDPVHELAITRGHLGQAFHIQVLLIPDSAPELVARPSSCLFRLQVLKDRHISLSPLR